MPSSSVPTRDLSLTVSEIALLTLLLVSLNGIFVCLSYYLVDRAERAQPDPETGGTELLVARFESEEWADDAAAGEPLPYYAETRGDSPPAYAHDVACGFGGRYGGEEDVYG